MVRANTTPPPAGRELRALARDVTWLKAYSAAVTVLLLGVPLLSAFAPKDPILRAKGLILEDAEGRARILIGAPAPRVPERVRTDPAKAEKAWGARYPNMDWFGKLAHDTSGILILDEQGRDRIAIGNPLPDPNIGRRIAPSTGIQINDEEGFERAGWGYFDELDRVGFGLDRRSGEGLNLFIFEDGTSGMLIQSEKGDRVTFVGHATPGHPATGLATPAHGVVLRDEAGARLVLHGSGEDPRVEVRDGEGHVAGRVPAK